MTDHLTHADVERIVQLVEEGGFGLVRLQSEGLYVELVRAGYEQRAVAAAAPSEPAPPPAPPSAPAAVAGSDARPVQVEAPTPPSAGPEPSGAVVVSPVVGIFYRAPDPESPPYVEEGQHVEAGATIGLVEVMKMYTAVKAEVSGRVAEVLVGNGEHVDRGQPLVRIAED